MDITVVTFLDGKDIVAVVALGQMPAVVDRDLHNTIIRRACVLLAARWTKEDDEGTVYSPANVARGLRAEITGVTIEPYEDIAAKVAALTTVTPIPPPVPDTPIG